MYPCADLTSQIGQLDNELRSLKNDLYRKADDWEINEIDSKISHLEYSIGEIRSLCDGIVFRLETVEERLQNIGNERLENE